MSPSADNDADDMLRKKLEELESLLDGDSDNSGPGRITVPVLDELVTEADFINNEDENDLEQIEEQITDLAEVLERKISSEMDQLVSLLKSNLRHNIVEQLRAEANLTGEEADAKDKLDKDKRPDP